MKLQTDLQKMPKLVSRCENILIYSHWTKVNFIIVFKKLLNTSYIMKSHYLDGVFKCTEYDVISLTDL